MTDLTYLYAVAREPLPCPAGVAGAPVRTITGAGLVAYVSTVPVERFGEEPLRRSLEDLDWLAETARAHHRVVDAVAAATTTAPVRLVTVYADDAQVAELLERRAESFADVLTQVTGRREWGVKAYTSPPTTSERPNPDTAASETVPTDRPAEAHQEHHGAPPPSTPTPPTAPASAPASAPAPASVSGEKSGSGERVRGGDSNRVRGGDSGRVCSGDNGRVRGGDNQTSRPGTAYLQRRRATLRGREQARRQALQRADHIHRALTALAAAGRRHRPQDPRLSGRTDLMLLNGAYLVDESRAEEFTTLAARLGGDGVEIRLTGPWAPYSFTVMDRP
ncbi:hypothetical protein GCM10009850_060940 [Nonomuraea monospora]|uniref:Gas vesicle protein GvpL/GvpF n=1 Tax=Nonomuraea monospora TaxID=568818 RepID=A0ABN3CMF4_9ACTN